MKDDRELLELAAKAAGIRPDTSQTNGGPSRNDGFVIAGNLVLDWHNCKVWNPLTDDGDALRLAVKLSIAVYPPDNDSNDATASAPYPPGEWITEQVGADPYAATRRAIVRAAAEIGRQR